MREHLTAALPARVLGSRPFDAASGSGQVGALQRELAKQRRGLGVRALLAQYGELITTRDAVRAGVAGLGGAVLPRRRRASSTWSCSTRPRRSGWPTRWVRWAGRRAAVVVGDSKQMPPTSFAEPTSGGDDSGDFPETTVEDEESILSECVQARVPRQWLSWHYRSQDESLIAFSNAQYYENRLSSFPAPTHGQASSEPDGRGVSLVRVPGTFHRSGAGRLLRTNPIEAKAIVAEIRRRFDLSLGRRRRRSASSRSTRSSGPTSRRCSATPTTTAWPRRSTGPTARACSSRTWRTCRATSATSSSSRPASR